MGTYCLPWTVFFLNFSHYSYCRRLNVVLGNKYLTAPLNTSVHVYNQGFRLLLLDGQMDGRMDRLCQADRHTGMSEEAWCRLARQERGSICPRVWGAAMASVNQDLPWRRWRAKKGRMSASGSGNHKWFKISSPKRAELSSPFDIHSTE